MQHFCPNCEQTVDHGGERCPTCGAMLVRVIDESLVGTDIDGKFAVKSLLGKGGRGAVYLAQQRSMDREVAIKVLRPEYAADPTSIARFYQEARAVSRLSHANCITVYDFGQTAQGLLYIVMEYLRGQALTSVVKEQAPLLLPRAVHIAAQICDALSEAHEKGIVHRDLKLGNVVLVQQHGNPDFVKVLDFGLAKVMHADGEKSLTAAGSVSGTPNYMSPEQVLGRPIDLRSDLYSLGVMLFEMLTRQRLFKADSENALMLKHVTDPVPRLAEVAPQLQLPPAVDLLLARALAKQRDERPASAAEFKQGLQALIDPTHGRPTEPSLAAEHTLPKTVPLMPAVPAADDQVPASAPPDMPRSEVPAASKPGRRRWPLLLVGAIVVVGTLIAAALWLRDGGVGRATVARADAAVAAAGAATNADAGPIAVASTSAPQPQSDAAVAADARSPGKKPKTVIPKKAPDGRKRLLPIE